MAYYASDVPRMRTGSIVEVRDVRVSPRYGAKVAASSYNREDRNGWSPALLRDTEERYARKAAARKARKVATKVVERPEDRAARERRIIGAIGSAD